MERTITIPLRIAQIINNAYLPSNPNKMRNPHPSVKQAVVDFQEVLRLNGVLGREHPIVGEES